MVDQSHITSAELRRLKEDAAEIFKNGQRLRTLARSLYAKDGRLAEKVCLALARSVEASRFHVVDGEIRIPMSRVDELAMSIRIATKKVGKEI